MDFISNLIKRPISLVITETSAAADKLPISSSLPTNLSSGDLEHDKEHQETQEQDNSSHNTQDNDHQHRRLSLSTSFNGNFTDFIGVSDELLGEFDEFLPPPPPLLSGSDLLSPETDNSHLQSRTPSPPPPPPLTPSMMASQTIDELLSEISDNLTLAGINDDVLAIASPPQKAELSPLASKASLNNSKSLTPSSNSSSQLQTPKTPTSNGGQNAAAGLAATSPAVFEANSTLHKFHVDPELATGLFEDQHQHSGLENTSGVNLSSNKFVGLTEFDETKIPELPGDLNPNIEEQYNVTFEECFIPTLTAKLGTKAVSNELAVEKTHLMLPNEVDNTSMSSANETFADCQEDNLDERDPLATTFAEQQTLNTTTDGDCYESAIQDEFREALAERTMDAGQLDEYQMPVIEQICSTEGDVLQVQDYEDEPMDVDMNVTMEVIHSSADTIQNVEKVLEHAENILQHLGEKPQLEEFKEDVKVIGSLAKPTETSKMTFVINAANSTVDMGQSQHLEMEQSNHDVSLNKSIELPLNKAKTVSSECVITAVNNDLSPKEENLDITKEMTASMDNKNLTINTMNTSTCSNSSSCKSPNSKAGSKLNLTTCMSTSSGSLKSSAPSSPSFPIKQTLQSCSFPKSPKTRVDNSNKPTFLEKSDYVVDLENKLSSKEYGGLNAKNVNGTFVEPQPMQGKNRLTFGVDTSDKRLTFNVASSDANDSEGHSDNKRLTFNVQSSDSSQQSSEGMSFPTKDKSENTRRTFCLNDVSEIPTNTQAISKEKIESRRTFNVPSVDQESTPMDTSYAPMDVDDDFSQNATMPMSESVESNRSNSTAIAATDQTQSQTSNQTPTQRAQSPALSNLSTQQRSQSPALPIMSDNQTHSTALSVVPQRSQSPTLSSIPISKADSPPLPVMQQRSNSPPLPTMQNRSDSPPLPAMQKRQSQSPPLPAMHQQRLQNPPLPHEEMQTKEESPPSENPIELKSQECAPPELSSSNISQSSPPSFSIIQKRQAIHGYGADVLSAKEQSNIKNKDEKDVFVEQCSPSPLEDMFTTVTATSTTLTNTSGFSAFDQSSLASTSNSNNGEQPVGDDEFQANNNLILNPSDFDYLLTKGNNNTPVDRSSLLLKFDPLLGVPVPVNQGQQSQQQQQQLHLQIPTNINNNPCLSPTIEEDEHNESTNRSFVVDTARPPQGGGRGVAAGPALSSSAKLLKERSQEFKQPLQQQQQHNQQIKRQLPQPGFKKNATMSVDVIKDMSLDNNDCNKTFENSNSTQPDDKQINYKMDELEKKVKNEVLKTEDIEKKLKDAEQREEALIKRITEKDKTVAKMNGVIEAYEKAIAELIAEKEQLIQSYEKQLAEVKADRDSNYHHLTSLETTFSDLHVKYEKSKEMTCQLKGNEEGLIAESRQNAENLRLQEQRYDKMKNHAMQQLEIANKKLECLTREHAMETTKLKALLKKEEIARSSMSEQLAQKSKENAELVKICDELISGQGS